MDEPIEMLYARGTTYQVGPGSPREWKILGVSASRPLSNVLVAVSKGMRAVIFAPTKSSSS